VVIPSERGGGDRGGGPWAIVPLRGASDQAQQAGRHAECAGPAAEFVAEGANEEDTGLPSAAPDEGVASAVIEGDVTAEGGAELCPTFEVRSSDNLVFEDAPERLDEIQPRRLAGGEDQVHPVTPMFLEPSGDTLGDVSAGVVEDDVDVGRGVASRGTRSR